MERRSAIRRAARENASHPAHIEAVKRLFDRLDSGGVSYEVGIEAIEVEDIGDSWGRELASRLRFAPVMEHLSARASPS